jgi:hypothetical protein
MIKLDLSYFLRLSAQMARIRHLKVDGTIAEARFPLQEVRSWLAHFGQEAMFGSAGMRTAKLQLPNLLSRIDTLLGLDNSAALTFDAYIDLVSALSNFDSALLSEAAMADAYYVLEKKPYSTPTLITEGETLFPAAVSSKVPEAFPDMQEAGKCLAFELPTAAAFHIHRATEAVLRRYWHAVAGAVPKPRLRSIGVFLAALKKHKCGDIKVISALAQMNELHRNPTIHPEDNLTLEEAIALLGMASSVIAAMLKQIPDANSHQPNLPGMSFGAIAQQLGLQSNGTEIAA